MIHVQNLHKSFGPKLVLEDVSFVLYDGKKVGLVGPNGMGKTTLFRILLGLEDDDGGSVSYGKEKLGYLPQKVEFGDKQNIHKYMLEGLDNEWEHFKIEDKLKIVDLAQLDRSLLVSKLSGGQKTRLALARLLLSEPTTLLLDEPTNNLDMPGLEFIESFVNSFKGSVFVISHDRMFLDRTVDKIFELDPTSHSLVEYTGGYTSYIEQKTKRVEIELSNFKNQEKKREKMQEWIRRKKEQLKYHQSGKVAKQMHAMETRYSREFEGDAKLEKPSEYSKIKLDTHDTDAHDKKIMWKLSDLQFRSVVGAKELQIYARDRIHLEGTNGSGKSTFIKMLMGEISDFEGSLQRGPNTTFGYFSQQHELLEESNNVINEFMKHTKLGLELEARKILGRFLFFGDHVFKPVSTLSEGEKVKLIMAILTYEPSTFLVLDEPTNHLDLDSRDILEETLREHKGGFLVVSHDRYFIQSIGISRQFLIQEGVVREIYS